MKTVLRKIILSNPITTKAWYQLQSLSFSNSSDYWKDRYKQGKNSGCGSYGELAQFKADILNNFVAENNITSVVEFGSGDGNQLALFSFSKYLGLDISPVVIEQTSATYKNDPTRDFAIYDPATYQAEPTHDLSLSLDVLYHLVEDETYTTYLKHLFGSARQFVGIYSNNTVSKSINPHVKTRVFTSDIDRLFPEWELIEVIENPISTKTNRVDFFFYGKKS